MTTCLGKSRSFGLLCVSFVNVYYILCVCFFPVGIEGGMWFVIVLIPDHCLSIYFSLHCDIPLACVGLKPTYACKQRLYFS